MMKPFTIAVVGVIAAFGAFPAQADAGCKFWDCVAAPFKAVEWVANEALDVINEIGEGVTDVICDFTGAANCQIGVGVTVDKEGQLELTDGQGRPAERPQEVKDKSDVKAPRSGPELAKSNSIAIGWDPDWGPMPEVQLPPSVLSQPSGDDGAPIPGLYPPSHDVQAGSTADAFAEVAADVLEATDIWDTISYLAGGKRPFTVFDLFFWSPDANPPGEMEMMLKLHAADHAAQLEAEQLPPNAVEPKGSPAP